MSEPYSHWDHLEHSESYQGAALWPWQRAALKAWGAAGQKGVVEAVTGTGKSLVGTAAIHSALQVGGVALVIVPTRALVSQWVSNLRTQLPGANVGALSGGEKADFSSHDVVVATVQSLYRAPLKGRSLTLVVADEVHRYGSPAFSKALSDSYTWRLGLTGTYERTNDDGIELILDPYFTKTVFDYSYAQALSDNVVAPFHLAFVGVDLTAAERSEFEEAEEKCKEAADKLRGYFNYPNDWREFFARVNSTTKENRFDDETQVCFSYMSGFSKKRGILAESSAKMTASENIAPYLAGRSGTLLFTETKKGAVEHAWVINKHTPSWPLDGSSSADERTTKLRAFAAGHIKVICAPRILDEGIDVPEAEVAMIVAASQSRRQMIQRMGRVIRKKKDGRAARIVIFFVHDSPEDPSLGGHESFLDEICPHAQTVTTYGPDTVDQIEDWLAND